MVQVEGLKRIILALFVAWFVGALMGYAAHGNIINLIRWLIGQG